MRCMALTLFTVVANFVLILFSLLVISRDFLLGGRVRELVLGQVLEDGFQSFIGLIHLLAIILHTLEKLKMRHEKYLLLVLFVQLGNSLQQIILLFLAQVVCTLYQRLLLHFHFEKI